MSTTAPTRRVERVRHEVRRREASVTSITPLGASFVSISFRSEALRDFASEGFDDHVKFGFIDSEGELVRRDYTPRAFDPQAGELTIEFLVHGHGEGSEWARRASIGMPVVIAGPKNSMVVPSDYDWHFLVGDAAALPAISRRLEELPSETRAIVIAQVDEVADRRGFASAAALDVRWVATQDELMAEVRALTLPAGEGFCWGAGEGGLMGRVREQLLTEKHHPREAMRLSAYWRIGDASFHETLEPGQARPAA